MKRAKHTPTLRALYNRYHHYILTGLGLLVIATSLAITGCDIINGDDGKTEEEKAIETMRKATEKYQDVDTAVENGFEQILSCTENPEDPGALGVVYINQDRLDTNIDLNKPEVLFYEPQKNGELQLVGGEPVVPIEQWDKSNNNPPSMLGREFHRNEDHGLYGLHMWVWRDNPEGTFAFWHPDVSCEYSNEYREQKGIETMREATEAYKDVDMAIADGFEMILPCTENPEGPGALGVVYINQDRLDTNIDLNKPEVLFYEPQQNGDLQLVGGEPVVPIEPWDESNNDAPSRFGREFHRNEDHGLYGLHMWVWKESAEGVFGFWNSNVSCEYASSEI